MIPPIDNPDCELIEQLTSAVKLFVCLQDDPANDCQRCKIELRRIARTGHSAAKKAVCFEFNHRQFSTVQTLKADWMPFSGIVAGLLMKLDGVYES